MIDLNNLNLDPGNFVTWGILTYIIIELRLLKFRMQLIDRLAGDGGETK